MYGFKKGEKPDKEAKPLKGGKIEGPGAGTSDSIKAEVHRGSYIMPADSTQQIGPKALGELGKPVPVNVSNGEYQMPPEQVHAVGVQALNQMRDDTHIPVAAGFKPQKDGLYFADGGSPAEEERRRLPGNPLAVTYGDMTGQPRANTAPQPRQAAPSLTVSYGDLQRPPSFPQPIAPSPAGSINTATGARPSAPASIPTQQLEQAESPTQAPQSSPASFSSMQREPNIPRSGQPRQMPQGEPMGVSGVADGLQVAGQRAAAGIQGASDQVAQAGRGFMAGGQAMTDQAATAAGSAVDAASGALNYLNRGDPVRDAANAIGGFFSRSAKQARGADYGGQPEAAAAPQPVAAPPATTPPSAASSTPAGDAQSTPAASQAAPAATAPTQQPMQGPALGMRVSPTSAPEINRIDNAPGLNSPLFTNLPTGQAVSEMQGGTVSALDMSGARAAAGRGGQGLGFQPDQAQQGPRVSRIGGNDTQALIDQFNTAYNQRRAEMQRGLRPGEVLARDRDYASALSSFLSSQGKSAELELSAKRADAQSQADQQRMDIDRQRVDLDRQRLGADLTARGFEARGMERAEKLYAAYESAKTPEERSAIAEQLRALSGKDTPNRYTVVPGGQEVTEQGMLRTVPSRVLNNQTGQLVDLSGQGTQALPPIAENPAVQKIMQNTALSREERAAQIRALGYK